MFKKGLDLDSRLSFLIFSPPVSFSNISTAALSRKSVHLDPTVMLLGLSHYLCGLGRGLTTTLLDCNSLLTFNLLVLGCFSTKSNSKIIQANYSLFLL